MHTKPYHITRVGGGIANNRIHQCTSSDGFDQYRSISVIYFPDSESTIDNIHSSILFMFYSNLNVVIFEGPIYSFGDSTLEPNRMIFRDSISQIEDNAFSTSANIRIDYYGTNMPTYDSIIDFDVFHTNLDIHVTDSYPYSDFLGLSITRDLATQSPTEYSSSTDSDNYYPPYSSNPEGSPESSNTTIIVIVVVVVVAVIAVIIGIVICKCKKKNQKDIEQHSNNFQLESFNTYPQNNNYNNNNLYYQPQQQIQQQTQLQPPQQQMQYSSYNQQNNYNNIYQPERMENIISLADEIKKEKEEYNSRAEDG